MSDKQELKDHFLKIKLSESDLIEYLQSKGASSNEKVYYFLNDQLKIEFNNKDKIKSIKGDLKSPLIIEALNELKKISLESTFEYSNTIVEGKNQLNGYYKYKDIFQIIPLTSNPKFISSGQSSNFPFPFIVVYKHRTCSHQELNRKWKHEDQQEVVLMLNLIVHGGIKPLNKNTPDLVWALVPSDWRKPTQKEVDMNITQMRPSSSETENMYVKTGFSTRELYKFNNQFTDSSSFPPVSLVNDNQYYKQTGIDFTQPIKLPMKVDYYFDQYWNLEDKTPFSRALFWLLKHYETWNISRSISYNCLVQAIEVLMGSQKETQNCKVNECNHNILIYSSCIECKKPIKNSGPNKLFREFIDRYAGDISDKIKKELYNLRSKISHGSLLLESDFQIFGQFNSKSHKQSSLMQTARSLVIICLINWLSAQKKDLN